MRVGIVGAAGSIGSRHWATLIQLPNLEIAACDKDLLSAEDLWRTKPEAVFICTPPQTHFQLVTNALHNGAHVFCEKPLATEPWQADTLVGLARKMDRVLAVGCNLRWQLAEFAEKANGQDILFGYSGDMRTWPSQYPKDALEEVGSHEIDAAVFVNGPVRNVVATHTGATWRIRLRHFEAISDMTLATERLENQRGAMARSTSWVFDPELNNQAYQQEVQAFFRVVGGGDWDPRLCPGVEAAHVCHLIAACRKSAAEFRIVQL